MKIIINCLLIYCTLLNELNSQNVTQIVNYSNGDSWQGEVKQGHRHGKGTYMWADGRKMVGTEINGKWEGTCKFFNKEGKIIYDGQYKNGLKDGFGVFHYDDGNGYVGDWQRGKNHGKGVLLEFNIEKNQVLRYVGTWNNGLKQGEFEVFIKQLSNDNDDWLLNSKCTYNNGEILNCVQYNGQLTYEGEYKNGLADGYGTAIYSNGDKWVGNFKDDSRYGEGIYYWKDGRKFIGKEINGKWEGYGKFYNSNGQLIYEGEYKNGNIVAKISSRSNKSENEDLRRKECELSKGAYSTEYAKGYNVQWWYCGCYGTPPDGHSYEVRWYPGDRYLLKIDDYYGNTVIERWVKDDWEAERAIEKHCKNLR
ncbi:MAG: hypothetical protein RLZZ546_3092 [Bacteroidota bacterium]|jgi:hypothetical protein